MRVGSLRTFTCLLLLLGLVVSPCVRADSQRPLQAPGPVVEPEIRTKLEALLATPDVLVSTDYYPIDMRFGPSLALDAAVVTDVASGAHERGLRVQVRGDSTPNAHEGVSYLDFDEAVSLSRALGSMSDLVAKWTGRDEQRATDLSFSSAGGFRLTIHQANRVQRALVSTGLIDPTSIPFQVTDLPTLKQAVDQALAILDGK